MQTQDHKNKDYRWQFFGTYYRRQYKNENKKLGQSYSKLKRLWLEDSIFQCIQILPPIFQSCLETDE